MAFFCCSWCSPLTCTFCGLKWILALESLSQWKESVQSAHKRHTGAMCWLHDNHAVHLPHSPLWYDRCAGLPLQGQMKYLASRNVGWGSAGCSWDQRFCPCASATVQRERGTMQRQIHEHSRITHMPSPSKRYKWGCVNRMWLCKAHCNWISKASSTMHRPFQEASCARTNKHQPNSLHIPGKTQCILRVYHVYSPDYLCSPWTRDLLSCWALAFSFA